MLTVFILPGKLPSDAYKRTRTSQSSTAPGSSSSKEEETNSNAPGDAVSKVAGACSTLRHYAEQARLSFVRGLLLYRNLNFTIISIIYFFLSLVFFFPIATAVSSIVT
eukprot:scpid105957/ scgid29285/ 